jgi:intracellular multiplication protein IcmB
MIKIDKLANAAKALNPDNFLDGVETVSWLILDMFAKNPRKLIDLEYTVDEHTIGMKDYSLMSFVSIGGLGSLVGEDQLPKLESAWQDFLKAWLKPGSPHQFIVSFESDPGGAKDQLENLVEPSRLQCERMGLDVSDLLDEKVSTLAACCRSERSSIALITQRYTESRDEASRMESEEREIAESSLATKDGMSESRISALMMDRHTQFVDAFVTFLKGQDYFFNQFTVEEITQHLIGELYGHDVANVPVDTTLTNSQIRGHDTKRHKDDMAMLLPKTFSEQILNDVVDQAGSRYAIFGDRVVAPIKVNRFPDKQVSFNGLIRNLQQGTVPYRVMFNIRPDGLSSNKLNSFLVDHLWILSKSDNKPIKKSLNQLRSYVEDINGVVVGVSMMFATWAPLQVSVDKKKPSKELIDLGLIQSRVATISARVKSWGGLRVDNAIMDPVEAALFTSSGVKHLHFSDVTPVPLPSCVSFLPITRPAMAWDAGTLVFRSPDGKVMPMEVASSLQSQMLALLFGPPRFGKSLGIAEINLNFIIKARESDQLPLVKMIDVGPTGGGLADLLHGGLDPRLHHLVQHRTITNTAEYCINNFDTYLGQRYPLSTQKTSLINFLIAVCSSVSDYKSLPGMLSLAIDEVYKLFDDVDDNPNAKRYKRGLSQDIDGIIDSINLDVHDDKTLIWHIVDRLFGMGHYVEAMLVQRYAVPTLADFSQVFSEDVVQREYQDTDNNNGLRATDMVSRAIREAIGQFPMISSVTQLDASDANVCIFDVKSIIKTPRDEEDKETLRTNAIGYLTMMNALLRDFFFDEVVIDEAPNSAYKPYLMERAKRLASIEKLAVFDEKHVLKGAPGADAQLDYLIATGPKLKIGVMLGSQVLDDASPKSLELATTVGLFGAGQKSAVDKATRTFGLSTSNQDILFKIVPPSKQGSELLLMTSTRAQSNQWQNVYLTLGPKFLWAMANDNEDRHLRNVLYGRLGSKEARAKLAHYFPGGTIKNYLRDRLNAMNQSSAKTKSVIDDIAEEIVTNVFNH